MWILRRQNNITAKKLGKLLNCRVSYKHLPKEKDFIINYGTLYTKANLNANVFTDKIGVLKKLAENGILVPKIYMKNEPIPDDKFPLFARKKYHSKGKDIIYIHNREELDRISSDKYDYLIEYIRKKSEYRVHILGENISIVNVKFSQHPKKDPLIRSKANYWKQISYEGEWRDALISLGKNVLRFLNYDFGAVDIIRRRDKLYVLEINSAPGLEERKLQIYADYFKQEEEKWRRNS
jgi:glutathione synthase/RimK-type ligase-like ATP-grasp enzyme